MVLRPLRGLRPRLDLASRIPSLPYDVVDTEEARALAQGDPYTFLHVVRPEIDLEPGVRLDDPRVYARGREALRAMVAGGWLVRDEEPCFYVYRLVREGRVQTGVVGAASIEDYRAGRIKRHELTRPDKELDRVRHTEALSAQPGMVFLTYRDDPAVGALVETIASDPPPVDYVAPDGVRHALWVVRDQERVRRLEEAMGRLPAAYIADGHHRAAAYARVGADRGHDGMLAALFPASQLRILDYNRVVRDLNGLGAEELITRLRAAGFGVSDPSSSAPAPPPGAYAMYLAGAWRVLTAPGAAAGDDPVASLDVQVLTDRVLAPLLGIGDVRTDPRIDFVGGARGMDELAARVDRGQHAVAFALHPTRLEDVLAVADAGAVMPPKSTWFEPKLRSGTVVHPLD